MRFSEILRHRCRSASRRNPTQVRHSLRCGCRFCACHRGGSSFQAPTQHLCRLSLRRALLPTYMLFPTDVCRPADTIQVYFLMQSDSVEEQKYRSALKAETEARSCELGGDGLAAGPLGGCVGPCGVRVACMCGGDGFGGVHSPQSPVRSSAIGLLSANAGLLLPFALCRARASRVPFPRTLTCSDRASVHAMVLAGVSVADF